MNLTYKEARKIGDACIEKSEAMGLKVSVAVINAEGRLSFVARMDESGYLTPDIAIGKASAAASFRRPSSEVQVGAEKRTAFYSGISVITGGRFLAGMGGLPIRKDGRLVGAVGVSGAKPEEDVIIAEAGLKTL
jgi:glc operon protein GlcG